VGDETVNEEKEVSLYDAVGGEPFFVELVRRFYAGVASDEILKPMYPAEDMTGAQERLTLFLMQFWGGPNTYSDTRGHPRLRMRHAPFSVDRAARDAWMSHMAAAVDSLLGNVEGGEPVIDALMGYFERSAEFMRNVDEPEAESESREGL
jgi:hemoglobin